MKIWLIKDNEQYKIRSTHGIEPLDAVKEWPSDVPVQAIEYIDSSEDIDAAHATYLTEKMASILAKDKASLIKDLFDDCDYAVGIAAATCFGTTNIDAMNADKDTIVEILKGNGYLVDSGFKARRDIPSESIVKGQVLNSQTDLERYAQAMWQNILDYGQLRVELMADRDTRVEEIENG